MGKFTRSQLEANIEDYNSSMESHGILKRFISGGRNGYQAADEYSVDENGNRIGSGVDRNVGCGTSREVDSYCRERHYILINQKLQEELQQARS